MLLITYRGNSLDAVATERDIEGEGEVHATAKHNHQLLPLPESNLNWNVIAWEISGSILMELNAIIIMPQWDREQALYN